MVGPTCRVVQKRNRVIIDIGNHELDHVEGDDPSGEEPFNPAWWNSGSHASSGECGVPTYVRWGSAVPDNNHGKSLNTVLSKI